jgi:hypothetical protein
MKKIFLFSILIIGTFFGCGLKAQTSGDEFGIKNEKDFVKFIKSVLITENKVSEDKISTYYIKTIKIGDNEYKVSLNVSKKYGNDVYDGVIEVKIPVKVKEKSTYRQFTKSKFEFMTHEDIIIGKIRYFTGPGPYLSGSNIIQRFANEKVAQKIDNQRSVPNIYETRYLLKGEFVFKPGEYSNYDYQESEDDDEATRLQIRKKRFQDSVNVLKKNESERFIIVGVDDESTSSAGTFQFNIYATSFNQQELKSYKITSIVRLIRKKELWVNNGSRDKWNYGYLLEMNPQKDNDTLIYKSWSPYLNGKIVDYKVVENEKVQMRSGEYKDGLQIGKLIEYDLSRKGDFEKDKITKVIKRIIENDSQGKPLKITLYSNDNSFYLNGDWIKVSYPYIIENYDPLSKKLNGMYQYFQLLEDKNITDKKILSTPIIKTTGNYLQGEKVGIWTEFFPNGKLKSKINHTTGESETYDEKGELLGRTFKRN